MNDFESVDIDFSDSDNIDLSDPGQPENNESQDEFSNGDNIENASNDIGEEKVIEDDPVPEKDIIEILSDIVKEKMESNPDPEQVVSENEKNDLEIVENGDLNNDINEDNKESFTVNSYNDSRSVETVQNDYSSVLGDILHALDNISGSQAIIIDAASQNTMNSGLNSQSATNVLLIVIILILLVDITVHFVRGIF